MPELTSEGRDSKIEGLVRFLISIYNRRNYEENISTK